MHPPDDPFILPLDKLRVDDPAATVAQIATVPFARADYEVRFDGDVFEGPGVLVHPRSLPPAEEGSFAALRADAARRFLHVEADYRGLCALLLDPRVQWVAPEPRFTPSEDGGAR